MQQTIKTVPNVFNQTESRRRDGRKEGGKVGAKTTNPRPQSIQ